MNKPIALKKFGQHYLRDLNIIKKICTPPKEFKSERNSILEIGPGPAILTKYLHTLATHFGVIEIDSRFEKNLLEILKPEQIFFGDALKIDFNVIFNTLNLQNIWLVSNLPYNVASPLMIKFCHHSEIFAMTLMMQKEVGDKILDIEPQTMNSLRCYIHTQFEVTKVCLVHPGAFTPPPKVESIVLHFKRRDIPLIEIIELEKFERFIRILFQNPRKIIKKKLEVWDKKYSDILFEKNSKLSSVRAETLTLAEVISIYKKTY